MVSRYCVAQFWDPGMYFKHPNCGIMILGRYLLEDHMTLKGLRVCVPNWYPEKDMLLSGPNFMVHLVLKVSYSWLLGRLRKLCHPEAAEAKAPILYSPRCRCSRWNLRRSKGRPVLLGHKGHGDPTKAAHPPRCIEADG